jgi:hypothetical protein
MPWITSTSTCPPKHTKDTILTMKQSPIKLATVVHDLRYNRILPELVDKRRNFGVEAGTLWDLFELIPYPMVNLFEQYI